MKFCISIKKNNAVKNAMKLVRGSRMCIHMTMDMEAENTDPLPNHYHKLIENRVKEGVKVYRYAYGKKTMFNKMRLLYGGVEMIYGGTLNTYQRMIIIDRKKGMFGLDGTIYYSEFIPLIHCILEYAHIK